MTCSRAARPPRLPARAPAQLRRQRGRQPAARAPALRGPLEPAPPHHQRAPGEGQHVRQPLPFRQVSALHQHRAEAALAQRLRGLLRVLHRGQRGPAQEPRRPPPGSASPPRADPPAPGSAGASGRDSACPRDERTTGSTTHHASASLSAAFAVDELRRPGHHAPLHRVQGAPLARGRHLRGQHPRRRRHHARRCARPAPSGPWAPPPRHRSAPAPRPRPPAAPPGPWAPVPPASRTRGLTGGARAPSARSDL